jgi:hypothetical protein
MTVVMTVMALVAETPMAIVAAMADQKLNARVAATATGGPKPDVAPATNRGPKRAVRPTNALAIRIALVKSVCERSGAYEWSCETVPKVGRDPQDCAGHWAR